MSSAAPKRVNPTSRFTVGTALRMGVTAAVIVTAANLLLQFGAQAAGVSFLMPGPTGEMTPLSWIFVVIASTLPSLFAPAVYGLCRAIAKQNPLRAFRIVAVVVLLLSFALPFAAGPTADMATKVVLNVMHVVAFAGVLAIVRE